MRKSLSLVLFFGLASTTAVVPSMAQVQGGHESEQDAIRFERQKDAASARQARIESGRPGGNLSADRSADNGDNTGKKTKARKNKSGSATRSDDSTQQPRQ